jgi:hypothetical protein
MFNFTSLLGAQSRSPASQSLLELDGGVKVLIDVGWDETFDVDKLKDLERCVIPDCYHSWVVFSSNSEECILHVSCTKI